MKTEETIKKAFLHYSNIEIGRDDKTEVARKVLKWVIGEQPDLPNLDD